MATLSDFATLADAQAHTEVKPTLISSDYMTALLTQAGMLSLVLDSTNEAMRAIQLILKSRGNFNFILTEPLGQANIAMLDSLIANPPTEFASLTTELTSFKNTLIGIANVTEYPFANITQAEFDLSTPEELALPSNLSQHIIAFKIATAAPKMTRVKVMQRFGTADNLTPWHACGGTNVLYSQSSYKVMVPAVDAEVREMKLVCDYSLGLSIG